MFSNTTQLEEYWTLGLYAYKSGFLCSCSSYHFFAYAYISFLLKMFSTLLYGVIFLRGMLNCIPLYVITFILQEKIDSIQQKA